MSGTFKIGDKTVVSHSDITDKTTLTADEAVISGSSSGDLVRITQTGSGNALVVEDETNPDSSPFVINNNGRLLLGTTSEVASLGLNGGLQIFGDNASKGSISLRRGSNDAQGVFVTIVKSRSSTDGTSTACSNGDEIGRIVFQAADGNDLASSAAEISANVDGNCGTDDTPGRLVFSTTADGASSPTERMRIESSGNVLVNASSFQGGATVGIQLNATNNASNAYAMLIKNSDNNEIFQFKCNGSAASSSGGSFGTTSDKNLKENIVDATPKLLDVLNLQVRNFNNKSDPEKTKYIGFIAQELETIFPNLVEEGVDGIKSVKTSILIPILTKAIQEQQTIIESQQSQIDALTTRIEALETA